jgi:hypothetical protein
MFMDVRTKAEMTPSLADTSAHSRAGEYFDAGSLSAENIASARNAFSGPRGLLGNYPPDVVCVVNGRPVTKGDILDGKREKQRDILQRIERNDHPEIRPCYVWVFYNDGWLFHGWYLYVRTGRRNECWAMNFQASRYEKLIPEIRNLFPCGVLPLPELFDEWAQAFSMQYARPTQKRSHHQGMVIARAVVGRGELIDVRPF